MLDDAETIIISARAPLLSMYRYFQSYFYRMFISGIYDYANLIQIHHRHKYPINM